MRYPLWAFIFVLVLPVFALEAVLSNKARFVTSDSPVKTVAYTTTDAPLLPMRAVIHRF